MTTRMPEIKFAGPAAPPVRVGKRTQLILLGAAFLIMLPIHPSDAATQASAGKPEAPETSGTRAAHKTAQNGASSGRLPRKSRPNGSARVPAHIAATSAMVCSRASGGTPISCARALTDDAFLIPPRPATSL